MKRFLLCMSISVFTFSSLVCAKNYDISQIDQVKLITEYSDDTRIEDIDTVTYGSYYQSNGSNKEAIEWIVLDRKEDSALLLSKYILDKQKFDDDINNYDKSTWEISSIRKWLNSKFLNNAFNDNEKSYIKPTTVINNDTDYVEYSGSEINNIHTDCGNDTIDKLFLLSIDEVKLYFGEKTDFSVLSNGSYYESDRVYKLGTKRTNYARGDGSVIWWLRSMGRSHHQPAHVSGGNIFSYAGVSGYFDKEGVRPAMWVTLNNNVSNSELTTNDNTINNQQDERKILGKSINEIGVIDTDQFKSVDEYDLGRIKVEALDSNNGNSNQNMLGDNVSIEGARVKNGWETDTNGLTFYYNNGLKARGWTTIKGDWYFFGEPDGHLVINSWIDKDGKTADSKLYYVGEDGKMYKNRQAPDGKWIGEDGLVGDTINNYQTNAESIYSNDNRTNKTTSSNQNILGDNVHIEGADVYQNPDGSIQIGGPPQEGAKLIQSGSSNDGRIAGLPSRESELRSDDHFYLDDSMQRNTWVYYVTYYYHVDGKGNIEKSKWITGAIVNSNGDTMTVKRYVGEDGRMYRGRQTPDGKWVGDDGLLVDVGNDLSTSLTIEAAEPDSWYKTQSGLWYYFENDRTTTKKGWFTDTRDNQTYYFDPQTGIMAIGWTKISGNEYYFNELPAEEQNWYETGGGFYESYGKKIKALGSMYKNETTPDGKKVDANGRLIT